MITSFIQFLLCPNCHHNTLKPIPFSEDSNKDIIDGVLICRICSAWFPIKSSVLELLISDLAYQTDQKAFYKKYLHLFRKYKIKYTQLNRNSSNHKAQKIQQDHFDWYATNDIQTYLYYEKLPFWKAVDSLVFNRWHDLIPDGSTVLDVGCGQGRSSFHFLDLPITIIGIDISKKMILKAQERVKSLPHRARTCYIVADATKLPFSDGIFDRIILYGVLHHLNNPSYTFKEISRLLKPNGMYLGSENNASVFRCIFDFFQRFFPLWYEKAGAEPVISKSQCQKWSKETPMEIKTWTSVFVMPHIVNLLPIHHAYSALNITDKLFHLLPGLRGNGGLVIIEASKR